MTIDALFDAAAYTVRRTQREQFVVPPLSVFDGGNHAWLARKRAWEADYPDLGGAGSRQDIGAGGGFGAAARALEKRAAATDPVTAKILGTSYGLDGRAETAGDVHAMMAERGGVGASVFDPVLAEIAYTWWTAHGDTIVDPFAGGPTRGVVAASMGRRYHGVDIRAEQCIENTAVAIDAELDSLASWHHGDSRTTALPQADFVFSCPPYGPLEVYSDLAEDLSTMDTAAFEVAYRDVIYNAVRSLKQDRFAAFVVGNYKINRVLTDFVGLTVAAFEAAGATYFGDIVLVTPIGSAAIRAQANFPVNRRPMPRHQMVLLFVKGDGRRAADRLAAALADTHVATVWDNYRPSNGTDGTEFRQQTCDRCVIDHAWHLDPDNGGDTCPIFMSSMVGEFAYPNDKGPPQWHHDHATHRSWCDGFVGPCECP